MQGRDTAVGRCAEAVEEALARVDEDVAHAPRPAAFDELAQLGVRVAVVRPDAALHRDLWGSGDFSANLIRNSQLTIKE